MFQHDMPVWIQDFSCGFGVQVCSAVWIFVAAGLKV